jgi:ribonuclease BN (tRNA processing enzyme)
VVAFLTDHEPALAADLRTTETEWISGFALMEGADLLIHDCQYTPDEYATRFGFGHSSTEHLAALAERAGPERVVMYHDPMHSDTQLGRCARTLHRCARLVLAAGPHDL